MKAGNRERARREGVGDLPSIDPAGHNKTGDELLNALGRAAVANHNLPEQAGLTGHLHAADAREALEAFAQLERPEKSKTK